MRVLLDTQVVILAYLGRPFPAKVVRLMEDPENERLVSAASVLEIAIKHRNGALDMSKEETSRAAVDLRLTIIPFYPSHAMRFFDLPLHHKDPFDRMLIATALVEGVPIISADKEFRKYKGLSVAW